jgi:hypothetical protein
MLDYARHSPYSDPGRHAGLLAALPPDPAGLSAVLRNVVVHYRASGIPFAGDRLAEIDSRWTERLLDVDAGRFAAPLAQPRPAADRVTGCCRDFTLLAVAALRQHGVPARSRVGFASYFEPGYHHDHVVAEFWTGERWRRFDPMLEPGGPWGFDPTDLPLRGGGFRSAAEVWAGYRAGELDVDSYGVGRGLPYGGAWFVRNYVLHELAHRRRDELLLWDSWGAMSDELDGDLGLIDRVAALLLAADDGDAAAERELAARYAADPRLHPGGRVLCLSPRGVTTTCDLVTREATPAAGPTAPVPTGAAAQE